MKWIKVSDRIPEYNTKVMVYENNHIATGSLIASNCWSIEHGNYTCDLDDVTHWMALPPSPEEEFIKCNLCSSTHIIVIEMRPLDPILYRYYCEAHIPEDAPKSENENSPEILKKLNLSAEMSEKYNKYLEDYENIFKGTK